MYDLVVCTCGNPIGFIFEFTILKQLNFSKQGDQMVEQFKSLFKDINPDHHKQLRHFLFVCLQHFQIYQIYDTQVALELLIKQYQQFWDSVPSLQLSDELVQLIYNNKSLIQIFNLMHEIKKTSQEIRTSDSNFSKQILDSQKISKMCCRSRIMTNVDFYTSRTYYASKLHH